MPTASPILANASGNLSPAPPSGKQAAGGGNLSPAVPNAIAANAPGVTMGIRATLTAGNIQWSAINSGIHGNDITIAITTTISPGILFSVSGNALSIAAGYNSSLVAILPDPIFNIILDAYDVVNGRTRWMDISGFVEIRWTGSEWEIWFENSPHWHTTDSSINPSSASGWKDESNQYVSIIIDRQTATKAQLIAAALESASALSLVVASASGDVSGTVSSLSATHLSGGSGPESIGTLRTASGNLSPAAPSPLI